MMKNQAYDMYTKDLVTGETKLVGSFPASSPIMSNDQLSRLTILAREIAVENDVVASIHIDKEGLNIYFFEKPDDEETPVSAEDE